MFINRTVWLPEISCSLSHSGCQLTLVIFQNSFDELVYYYKHTSFNWWCYGRLPHSENQYHPRR
jgi:hypothetical protein